jgi:hypothetical protein
VLVVNVAIFWDAHVPLKHWFTRGLHDAVPQKMATFNLEMFKKIVSCPQKPNPPTSFHSLQIAVSKMSTNLMFPYLWAVC